MTLEQTLWLATFIAVMLIIILIGILIVRIAKNE